MKRVLLLLAQIVGLVACGTLGDTSTGAADLPSAGVGPFRALADRELKGIAPFVLEDAAARYADPAVLRDDSGDTLLYAVSGGTIVRTRATDGRTFFGNGQIGRAPAVVLGPTEPWEVALSGPFAFRLGTEIWLYYAGEEGIAVARSGDGLTFTKEPGPVLFGGAAPSVYALPDGRLRMLYARGPAIEEAESVDGLVWQRLGTVLAASGEAGAFDAALVGDPCVTTRITPAGRYHVRVLYTGTNEAGATAIGVAARYGLDGPLDRNPVPTYKTGRAPALLDDFLYVEQPRLTYPAIAAAVQPASVTLPAPSERPLQP